MNLSIKKYISLAVVVLMLGACGGKKENSEENSAVDSTTKDSTSVDENTVRFTPEQYRLAGITTGSIEERNLSNVIKLNGVIDVEPTSIATVSAPLGGYIKTAGKLPGEYVSKGQLIASLENAEIISMQQQYLESIGRMDYLEQEFKRQQQLRSEDINSAKTFQQVSSEYKINKAKISGLSQQLGLVGINSSALKNSGKIARTANLYAPISGYIKTSNVSIGKYASPTDVLFEIVGKSDMHLALNAFERDLAKIEVGGNVKFSLASENNFNRNAKVFLIGKAAGENKMIPVHCHMEDASGLVVGMYVKAWIETGTEKQLAVPTDAIVKLGDKDYLVVQVSGGERGYVFHLDEVKRGTEQEGYTAVLTPSHLDVRSAKIVTNNAYAILSALRNAAEEE